MSKKLITKWIADDAINEDKIDWGTGTKQVCAELMPIKDNNNLITATQVEDALQEIFAKYLAQWNLVSGFTANGGDDDVDTVVKAVATNSTPRTNFSSGRGIFVDASGDYSGGLPSNGVQVTEYGKSGMVIIRNSSTKDPITDGNGNTVYGILFYNTNNNKFYIKYFSDINDVQTAYSFSSNTNIDFYFPEIFQLANIPAEGWVRGGLSGAYDVTVDVSGLEKNQVKRTLNATDISNGYYIFSTKAYGGAGTKTWVRLTPMGGIEQEYGIDFTAMNTDANDGLAVIWKTSGSVAGISSPTYPTVGMSSDLAVGDVIQVYY